MPEDASPPLLFPPPHPDAAGSHGDVAAAWIGERLAEDKWLRVDSLRWWQWLVLQRLLEHREDGSACHPVSLVSVGRQQGKSELLCELAAFRCAHPDLFGGRPQEVSHSANTVQIARKIQAQRWQWAEWREYGIARQLGATRIVWPDGSVWETHAPENAYSRSIDLLLADEAWSWDAESFWEACYPTLAERPHGQAVLFSTAHDRARDLVQGLLGDGRASVMLWGAPEGADESDRAVWAAASAHYDEQRERVLGGAFGHPGFAAQWLNRWPFIGGKRAGWLDVDAFAGARADLQLPDAPAVVAVEDWYGGDGGAVAAAWADGDGLAVSAWRAESLAEAWRVAASARTVLCGASLLGEPEARALGAAGRGTRNNSDALLEFRRLVADGGLRWDGDGLADQVAGAVVEESTGNVLRLRKGGMSGLLRCAAWAVQAVRRDDEPVMI